MGVGHTVEKTNIFVASLQPSLSKFLLPVDFLQGNPLFERVFSLFLRLCLLHSQLSNLLHTIPILHLREGQLLIKIQLPKESLFHALSKDLISLSFLERMKLVEPLKDILCHQPSIKSWKPSAFNHIFSKLKGVGPRLIPP